MQCIPGVVLHCIPFLMVVISHVVVIPVWNVSIIIRIVIILTLLFPKLHTVLAHPVAVQVWYALRNIGNNEGY